VDSVFASRRAALKLGAVSILLARISTALQCDPLPASAEPMLLIVELLVEEVRSVGTLEKHFSFL